jgi:hypothetical protein
MTMTDTPLADPSFTISEFCAAERISRVALYGMWKCGKGPRFYFNGRCRRITHSARMLWQRQREAEAILETEASHTEGGEHASAA